MCCFFKQKTAYEMRISDWSSDVCSSDLWPRGLRPSSGIFRGAAVGCSSRCFPFSCFHPKQKRLQRQYPDDPEDEINRRLRQRVKPADPWRRGGAQYRIGGETQDQAQNAQGFAQRRVHAFASIVPLGVIIMSSG